ncbi:DAO domain containing protein [Trichuris trichiura]|uniref:L-2-hydroxyglutarate dehydrogenase, mitochondrial n=1 Tax=Trichuris trichiura TaxID=36087 RepID=A0A077Z2Z6_TRITR|nr:DAO domain containing protein [Trichuris trichiura]
MPYKSFLRFHGNVKPVWSGIQQAASSSKIDGFKYKFDIVVVGGGIVGCATAREVAERYPKLKVAVVEKEDQVAVHQSSRNSGVIHAGIYYTPGSLKAKLCVHGLRLVYDYLDKKRLPYKKCGKLIVAVEHSELPRLQLLYERGKQNGTPDIKIVDGSDIPTYEPYCKGLKAIWSPHTGIVDWAVVTKQLSKDLIESGGQVITNFCVDKFELNEQLSVSKSSDAFPLSLFSRDQVPHPGLPFLGVHFSSRMNGDVLLGPNAVLAFRREGYGYLDFKINEFFETVGYRGLQKLAVKHFAYGLSEFYRSIFIRVQVKQLQRYIPSLSYSDVTRGLTGVRAQALDREGSLVDDFVFDCGSGDLSRRILHTRNAPSPAATSSLSIAKLIVDKAAEVFCLQNGK